jgi:hypothetical protein
MAKIMSVSLILFLIVVVTIMNGYKVEGGEILGCANAYTLCLINRGSFACDLYCQNCLPTDPICHRQSLS